MTEKLQLSYNLLPNHLTFHFERAIKIIIRKGAKVTAPQGNYVLFSLIDRVQQRLEAIS